jgi:hypothetical protein
VLWRGTQRAPRGQTHVETLPLFFVTLTKNLKSREIYEYNLNSLNNTVIKVELYRAQASLTQCYNCKTLAMSGPSVSNTLDVCDAVMIICIQNAQNKQNQTSWPVVCKRTILIERPPFVGEVSAHFCEQKVSHSQCNRSPQPLISFF